MTCSAVRACAARYIHSALALEWPFLYVSVLFSSEPTIWLQWLFVPIIVKNTHQQVPARCQMWQVFFRGATSWRQYHGGPALAVNSSPTRRQRIFGVRTRWADIFTEVTLHCRGVLKEKKIWDALPLLSVPSDKGTVRLLHCYRPEVHLAQCLISRSDL